MEEEVILPSGIKQRYLQVYWFDLTSMQASGALVVQSTVYVRNHYLKLQSIYGIYHFLHYAPAVQAPVSLQ